MTWTGPYHCSSKPWQEPANLACFLLKCRSDYVNSRLKIFFHRCLPPTIKLKHSLHNPYPNYFPGLSPSVFTCAAYAAATSNSPILAQKSLLSYLCSCFIICLELPFLHFKLLIILQGPRPSQSFCRISHSRWILHSFVLLTHYIITIFYLHYICTKVYL